MATEAAAFLLKQKLQSLLDGGGTVFPGLEVKIIDAIGKLGQLSHHHLKNVDDDDEVRMVLTSIHGLEDAIDVYLIRIRRRQPRRWWRWWIGGDPAASTNFPALLIRQMYLRQGITKFLKEVKNVSQLDSARGPSSCWLTDRTRGDFQNQDMEEEERKKEVKNLVSQLITDDDYPELDRDDMRVLTVVGWSGHGKTELVRSAYNSTQVKRHFQFRAWVSVNSKEGEDSAFFRHVLVDLIHQGTMSRSTDLDHMKETALRDMLFKMLMEKTYLIVFDNVCSCEAWAKLVVPIPGSQNGSRVVVTTRAPEVANFVDPLNPPTLMLGKLTCQGSWQLLLKQVNPSVVLNYQTSSSSCIGDDLKEIVMRKCCGIWMAITLLGGVLYSTQLSEWEGVINDVPDNYYNMEEEDESSRVVADMFDFSFRTLRPVLKACLVYIVLFPEEVEIPVRRLLHLWLAEGFFLNTNCRETATLRPEDAAQICLEELINRKLIEVTKRKPDRSPKTCRMQGFIRNILLRDTSSSSVQGGGLFDVHRESISGSSRRFADHSSSNNMNSVLLPRPPDQSQTNKKLHLHSFLSFNTRIRGTANTDIGNFLKVLIRKSKSTGFALLRVLDLEGVYKPLLPDTIGTLVLLKFLGLRLTVLDSIPESVCKLPLLETLDLKNTNVNTLPTSVWESNSLRHLYINEIRLDGSSVRKVAMASTTSTRPCSSYANFQTLRGLYIVDKKAVSNVLDRFKDLRKVGITCHENSIDQVTKWISGLSHLETLKLRSLDRLGKPSHLATELKLESKKVLKLYLLGKIEKPIDLVTSLPKCLRKLTLSSSGIEEVDGPRIMEVLGDLPELIILRLLADTYKGTHMTCLGGKFPKLRGLKLWMLPELEVWKVEKGAMPCLEELEIRKCNKMNALDGLEHLSCLNELVLTNMPENLADSVRKISPGRSNNFQIKENSWKFSYYNQDETRGDN